MDNEKQEVKAEEENSDFNKTESMLINVIIFLVIFNIACFKTNFFGFMSVPEKKSNIQEVVERKDDTNIKEIKNKSKEKPLNEKSCKFIADRINEEKMYDACGYKVLDGTPPIIEISSKFVDNKCNLYFKNLTKNPIGLDFLLVLIDSNNVSSEKHIFVYSIIGETSKIETLYSFKFKDLENVTKVEVIDLSKRKGLGYLGILPKRYGC